MGYRTEHDSLGEVLVPEDKYWGAQTERSFENFKIGTEKMPQELIAAFAVLKKAAAKANKKLGKLTEEKCGLICTVCDEILEGKLYDHFPLAVWQTGSGTQTNMNLNEVIANRGNEIAGKKVLHPNDDVNKSQSSNDTFPTAMRIAAVTQIERGLIPALDKLISTFDRLESENKDVIKVGRTHLQDAVPLRFSQEISGWKNMLIRSRSMIISSLDELSMLPLGGTAVGTGLNAPEGFDIAAADEVSSICERRYITADNKFHALTSLDGFVYAHGALKGLAADAMKIANDVRWLSSGPRCGIGEIKIPENEPGSSIMPGKVNPTQCEALTMTAVQVMGNDTAVGMAASQGNFQLNVYLPVCIYNFLQSVRLLGDALESFNIHCASGITANREKMEENLQKTLMLVTALNTIIGYDNAAKVAKKAFNENISLKEAVVSMGLLSDEEAERALDPEKML